MYKTKFFGLIFYILFLSCNSSAENIGDNTDDGNQTVSLIGKTLPDWEEGYLDIHAINTGRGESTFYIFPDGTNMLVDAAGSTLYKRPEDHPIPATDPKPNGNISSGQVIVNYINHFTKATNNEKLNYLQLSHFHSDHMGSFDTSLPLAPSGDFIMSGITEVGAKIPVETIIDRGYPNYNYPTDLAATNNQVANYVKFVNWAKEAYNATVEQFDVGKSNQIVLRKTPSKYNNFQVRNIAGNGKVWSGSGTTAINKLPTTEVLIDADAPENIFSIGFQLSYGKFDYFSGGDLQYTGKSTYSWKDIETPVANVMTSVDVMKANHHGTANCNGEVFLNKLAPQDVLIHSWRDVHPNPATISRMYTANKACRIYTTNMTNANKARLADYMPKINSTQGHIVVRVAPDGLSYMIYILEDTNEEYKVKKIFGPYQSN